ncbi:MAG: anhydro-N-acetylmuramic acid kinase [Hyphomicrobiales bacterium]|nr:anhydro-N-acetylmuramic acid kinase [Hyphomicrobiales bacterium]MDE2016809.1 anhydro-N-acetylmuramic acid kinase [Hyphomicrobiales bacterium]
MERILAGKLAAGLPLTAIGVMSGTSVDGIDVALLETDGRAQVRAGPAATYPQPPDLAQEILEVAGDPARGRADPFEELEGAVADAHAGAVERFLADFAIPRTSVDLVGLHGQTVLHEPRRRFTRQLLDGERAAKRLGLPVVFRFRHADVAAGGEGAPLLPLYHRALASGLEKPLAVLNLGGVGNVTWLGEGPNGGEVLAFDTGPANAPLDDFLRARRGASRDEGGALAGAGWADGAAIARFAADPYFAAKPPKSLDRNHFRTLAASLVADLSDADGAATLTAAIAESVAVAARHFPAPARRWLVCGGGRRNATLMRALAARLATAVEPVEAVGWDGDNLEAQGFAYLAVRSVRGLPLSLPTTTGVPRPMTGGETRMPGT